MSIATIMVMIIGIIAIVISFVMTSDDAYRGEEAEERTTAGLPEELTEADKKKLRKMVDQFTNEYSNKKVKEAVRNSVNAKIDEQLSQKQDKIDEKLRVIDSVADSKVEEINRTAETDVQKIDEYYLEIMDKLAFAKKEAETACSKASDKSSELKKQFAILEEYKKAIEKMKTEAGTQEFPSEQVEEQPETDDSNTAELKETSEDASDEVMDKAVEEEVDEKAEDTAVEEENEESSEAAEADEIEEDEEDEEELLVIESMDESSSSGSRIEELSEPDETPFFGSRVEKEEEERRLRELQEEEEEEIRRGNERTTVLATPVVKMKSEADESEDDSEYNNDDEFADIKTPPLETFSEKVQKVISFPKKSDFERVKSDPSIDDDLFDEEYYDDDEDDGYDDTDLRDVSNLDEILDREGIDITDGDVEGNVLGMYHAGFSIIEISKVMKMGVGEVKYIIDHKNK